MIKLVVRDLNSLYPVIGSNLMITNLLNNVKTINQFS